MRLRYFSTARLVSSESGDSVSRSGSSPGPRLLKLTHHQSRKQPSKPSTPSTSVGMCCCLPSGIASQSCVFSVCRNREKATASTATLWLPGEIRFSLTPPWGGVGVGLFLSSFFFTSLGASSKESLVCCLSHYLAHF